MIELIAQIFGIAGMIVNICSFQCKKNSWFFATQALGGLMFAVNFLMIGAVSAALLNIVNIIRGTVLSKGDKKIWKLIVIESLYIACIVISVLFYTQGDVLQTFLSVLTFAALFSGTVVMWNRNGKFIRYAQVSFISPVWIIHNIINLTIGGILCECFNMISVIVSFVRYGKDGFEK